MEDQSDWTRFCHSMAARCLECSSLGMRGDPMGILRVSSSSHQVESDSTPDSPRPSTNNGIHGIPENVCPECGGNQTGNSGQNESQQEQQEHNQNMGFPKCNVCVGMKSRYEQLSTDPMLFPRIALMVMVFLVITVLSVSTFYVAAAQIRRTFVPIVSSLRTEATYDVRRPLEYSMNYTRTSVSLLAQLFSASDTTPQLRNILWTGFFLRPGTTWAGFVSTDGTLTAYTRNSSRTYFITSRNTQRAPTTSPPYTCLSPKSYTFYREEADSSTGRLLNSPSPVPCMIYTMNYTVYGSVLNSTSGDLSWDIAVDTSGELLLFGFKAVKTGLVFVGRKFNNMLDEANAFGQQLFLMSSDRRLIGVYGLNYSLNGLGQLSKASESNISTIAYVARSLERRNSRSIDNLLVDGDRYNVNTITISGFGKDLVAVLIISVKSFQMTIQRHIHIMGMIFLGISFGIFLIGCCLVVMLTKGVSLSMRVEQSYIAQVKATKLAEKRSNHKKLFFANMSHDLRTPLAAILGLIDLCLSHKENAVELETNMVQMKNCANTLLGILNSILDMSKAEVGKLELDIADFDLIKVLEEAVDIFAVVGAKKGIEVVLELPDDSIELARHVRGDAGRVKQLVCDLLSNGVKFTTNGHVILRAYPKHPSLSWVVSASRRSGRWFHNTFKCCFTGKSSNSDSGNGNTSGNLQVTKLHTTDTLEFEFEVEDTGLGIPHSRREAVFRNFVQGSSRVHCTYGGTGLGLAIVRSLVHMMGGQIKVFNKEGPGTLFKFNLLFQKPSQQQVSGPLPRMVFNLQQSFGEESQLLENAAPQAGGFDVQNLQVVLGMQGELGRKFVSTWMQKKGAQVNEVSHWQQIIPCLERVLTDSRTSACSDSSSLDLENSTGNGSKPRIVVLTMLDTALIPEGNPSIKFRVDLDELVRASKGLGKCIHLSWIFSADTSNMIWQTLHRPSDLIIHKPVHGSRLVTVLEEFQAQHFQHTVSEERPSTTRRSIDYEARRRSSSSQNGGKQPVDIPTVEDASTSRPRRSYQRTPGEITTVVEDGTPRPSNGDRGETSGSNVLPTDQNYRSNGNSHTGDEASGSNSHQDVVSNHGNLQPGSSQFVGEEAGTSSKEISTVELTVGVARAVEIKRSLEGMRILVVEDTFSLQKIAKAMLEREGAVVEVASNGKEAVNVFGGSLAEDEQQEFDLILMDCQMPVMDGYAATIRIRELEEERPQRTTIIALTAHAMSSDAEKCKQVGMDAYLSKPLNLKQLIKTLNEIGLK